MRAGLGFLALLAVLLPPPVSAAPKAVETASAPLRYTAGDVLQGLLEAQDRRAWTKAELVKTEHARGDKGAPVVTLGRMIASGGKARLEISKPAAGLIVDDGRHLWVELPQVDQVYRYDQAQLAASGNFFLDLASSIRHYAKHSVKRRFRPGLGYDGSDVSAFELVPTASAGAGFERMRVWVDTRRWVVLRVRLDFGGTASDIAFKDIQVLSWKSLHADPRLALPRTSFKYRKPKGFEIFKMDL